LSPRFVLFGAAHLAVLAIVGVAAGTLPWLLRRRAALRAPARIALALALAGLTALYLVSLSRLGPLSIWDVVPLHLCDFLILVALLALFTLNQTACELVYFWGGTGTLLATVTPDLVFGWPDWRFVVYFGLHGAVVVTASCVAFGLGRPPRPGAALRVFLLTNAYAAVVAVVDVVWGMNFLYLRAKPSVPTLLDGLGPWPLYLMVVEALALGLFVLLEAPLRLAQAARLRPRRSTG
jgi:hypothetical integral membrane protein (TIGR02206 family)